MKLKSFGCSFTWGSDLSDVQDLGCVKVLEQEYSLLTWPALIAKKLNLEYECLALPGQGNFKILCDILANSYANEDAIYVVNWTWIDRFDYVNDTEDWSTLRPGNNNSLNHFYYKHFHSQICDMISSACYINSAIEHLTSLDIPFLMTYVDDLVLEQINPNWHDPRYLEVLQKKIAPYLKNFNGKNFIEWSKDHKFPISQLLHPLDQAHAAAAEFFLPEVKSIISQRIHSA